MSLDVVNIINLHSRADRASSIVQLSKEHKLPIRIWEGVVSEKLAFSNISIAFKNIIKWAKECRLSRVIIAEDDLQFTAIGAWEYYLKNTPSDYDIYLGGIYSGSVENNRITNGYSGNTLLTIHNRFYDFVLSAPITDHLDRWLGNYAFENKYIVCAPQVCYQIGGYSDNHRRKVSYDAYYEGREWFINPPPAST